MDGKTYTTGQKWYQGCEKICVCDDGKTGAITCNQRYSEATTCIGQTPHSPLITI